MRCINQNHPDFIDLLRKTGSNPKILAAQVSVWMDENNTDNIPSTKDIGLNYTVKTSPELYRKYNLLNKDGSLKKLSKEVADKWVNTNNQTSKYIFKVVKTTPDTYSIVIQDNYSNLSKPQKNTIDKIIKEVDNIEDEGNYTTNEEGDVIIKNKILGLPNELSDPEIIQGPIDYSQESKFRKNNPNFDSERYVNDQGKFGKVEAPLDESLTPFLSETREKAQQYSAEFIADSFKLKDKPNERKFNRPTNLPESFRLVWGEVNSNKFNALATDELGGILRWVRRMDRQNSKEQSIPFVKGVMGRDAKSIYSENGGNDVDTKTRYGILRVIQSINDSDVLLGIFRRLGMGEIRVINNKRLNSLFVHNGSLYINEAKWSENLQDKFNKGINLDEYIELAVFEELIHLVVGKLTNNKTILEASEELDDNDKRIVNKFYLDKNPQQFFSSDLKPLQTINELIRMKVQKDLAGISTEDIANSSFTKDSFINDIVNKIWDFIMFLFKDKLVKTNKIAEEVKNYIKGLNTDQIQSEFSDEILGLPQNTDNSQQQLVDKIKSVDEQIEKKQSENLLDENGNPKDAYFYKGREILNRVTDKAKKVYENVFRNKDLTKTEFEKLKQETFAEYGTKAHSDIEHIISQLTDKDGKFIDTPFDNSYKPLTNKKIYKALFDNLKERMQTYPNAVFLSEIKVLDEDKVVDGKKGIAGTIDLLIIKEDGSIQILLLELIDLNTDKYEDVPWFKKKAYDVQIGEYRRILSEKYGIPLSSIKGAAIPIKTKYEYKQETKDGVKPPPILRKIEIGNVNVNLEDKDYLLPVTLSTQSTGSKELDKYISKLNNLKQNIENREVSSDEQRMGKAEQLQALDKAIRHLSVKHSIQPLINQANTFTKDVENVINTFNNNYKDLNFEQSLINNRDEFKTELNEYGIQLDKALAEISIYTELDVDLQPLFGTDISQETKETIEELSKITSNARFLQKALVEVINEFGEKVGESIGYKGITDAEVQVSMDARLFKETSKIPIKTLRVFYEFRREAQNLAEQQTLQENEELTSILKDYEEMAKSKGLTIKNMFSLVMNYAENKLIDQYKREFYNTANDKIKQKDYKWIKENVDVEKYEEAIKKRLEQEINFIDKKNISEQDKNTQILKKKKEYDLSRTDSPGWFIHPSILKAFPQDKWISEEWETMQSTPAAKRLYEWIRNINKKAEEVGYIPQGSAARTFLPFVAKSYMEKMVFGGSLTLGEEFLRSITIDEDTIGYGNIDPLTNKPINKIPKYFTRATDKELSTNLIKNLAIYNQALNNYKFVSQTEGIGLALSRLEQNKEVILTNQWGKAFYDKETDTFKTGKNVQNAELFEKQLATLLYGQKYVQSESFDQLLGSVGKLGEKINAKLGFKLLPENFEDKQISMNKSLDTLNTYFQQKTLGLNPLTALSNLIGGKLQLTIGAGKYFTKKDLIKAEWDVDSSRVTEEGKKIIAALKYFQPFTSNEQNKDLIKKLSVTKLTETNIQELLMSMMRGSDLWVQSTIFASLWNNAVLIDGKVHNARDYIRTKTDYKNRYTQGNLQEQEAKFNELVEDLLKQHGIKNKAKLNSEGELYIEELTPNNIESFKLKNLTQALTKRVTGNLNPSEVRSINQNVYTNSFMVFKNWIPSLMSVRFAKLNYSSDVEAFEWGRARTVARIMSREGIKSLSSLVDLLTFNTFSLSDTGKIVKGTPEGLKTLQELYEFKKQQVYQQTGQKLELDENEFYDLVRQNIRNQAKDTLVTLSLLSMFFALKAVPDDDEDENVKNYHKFMVRTLDKISDEVSFYYSPTSFQTILNGSVMPSIGVFSDGIKVIQKALTELYAVTTGDDELQEKNYVLKYIFKSFPVSSQMSSYLPLYAPDLAKELGITFTNQSRR